MKNRLLRVLFLTLFGCASFYLIKSWRSSKNESSFDVENVEFTQQILDVSELGSEFPNPIWFIKADSPVISFEIVFKNEGDRSFCKTPGLLDIVIGTLMDGAGDKDGAKLKQALSEKSISLEVTSDCDDITVSVTCLDKYLDAAIGILCDVLSKAHLKKEKLEIARQGCIITAQQSKFNPRCLASEKMRTLVYGKQHPYYWTYDGEIEAIQKYTKADADRCYASIFSPADALITFVGNVNGEKVKQAFERIYKAIANKKNKFIDGQQRIDLGDVEGEVASVNLDTPQSSVLIELPGVSRTSREKFFIKLANIVLGANGVSSRLCKAIREKDGLVYSVSSKVISADLQACVLIEADTRPENVDKVIAAVKTEIKEMHKNGLTQDELTLAKTIIFTKNALPSSEDKKNFVSRCRLDGVKIEEVNSYQKHYFDCTLDEVNVAIKKVFDSSRAVVTSCGKARK
jgi:zinc protease